MLRPRRRRRGRRRSSAARSAGSRRRGHPGRRRARATPPRATPPAPATRPGDFTQGAALVGRRRAPAVCRSRAGRPGRPDSAARPRTTAPQASCATEHALVGLRCTEFEEVPERRPRSLEVTHRPLPQRLVVSERQAALAREPAQERRDVRALDALRGGPPQGARRRPWPCSHGGCRVAGTIPRCRSCCPLRRRLETGRFVALCAECAAPAATIGRCWPPARPLCPTSFTSGWTSKTTPTRSVTSTSRPSRHCWCCTEAGPCSSGRAAADRRDRPSAADTAQRSRRGVPIAPDSEAAVRWLAQQALAAR